MPNYIGISKQLGLTSEAKPIDVNIGPYASTAAALIALDSSVRYVGLTVLIVDNGSATEYWFKDGIADSNLVPKENSGGTVNFVKLTQTEYNNLEEAGALEEDVMYCII